jgi:hypothetical protein
MTSESAAAMTLTDKTPIPLQTAASANISPSAISAMILLLPQASSLTILTLPRATTPISRT